MSTHCRALLTMWKADNTNALVSKLYNAKLKDTFTFGALAAASEPSERLEDNPVSHPPPSAFTSTILIS